MAAAEQQQEEKYDDGDALARALALSMQKDEPATDASATAQVDFVAEALSVIIQVASFKTRGKRVFRMAPVHHHYQKKGWPEQKITVRIWIISFILALLSILTLKLR